MQIGSQSFPLTEIRHDSPCRPQIFEARLILSRTQDCDLGELTRRRDLCSFLVGSITSKVLHDARCPVWTDAHAEAQTASAPAACVPVRRRWIRGDQEEADLMIIGRGSVPELFRRLPCTRVRLDSAFSVFGPERVSNGKCITVADVRRRRQRLLRSSCIIDSAPAWTAGADPRVQQC